MMRNWRQHSDNIFERAPLALLFIDVDALRWRRPAEQYLRL